MVQVGTKVVVHLDTASFVRRDPDVFQAEAFGRPLRPAEYMTTSPATTLPLARVVNVPPPCGSTASTVSRKRKVTARLRRWNCKASTISSSQKSSIRSRCSITVTLVPRAANTEAYSMPMTPAPTITRVRGMLAQSEDAVRIEDVDVIEGDAVRAGGTGADGDNYFVGAHPLLARPVAHGDRVVVYSCPRPWSSATRFLDNWSRITSISRPTTWCVRRERSSMVMSSFTL